MANKIYRGNATYGTPDYSIKGDKIYTGNATYGTPAYTIS